MENFNSKKTDLDDVVKETIEKLKTKLKNRHITKDPSGKRKEINISLADLVSKMKIMAPEIFSEMIYNLFLGGVFSAVDQYMGSDQSISELKKDQTTMTIEMTVPTKIAEAIKKSTLRYRNTMETLAQEKYKKELEELLEDVIFRSRGSIFLSGLNSLGREAHREMRLLFEDIISEKSDPDE